MRDLVSIQNAIDEIDKYIDKFDCIDENFLNGLKTTKKILNNLPSSQSERPKGKWINRKVVPIDEMSFDEWQQAQCSECGMWHTTPYKYYFENYKYCPHCGEGMRGD